MDRKIIVTADGSTTIHLADWDEQYHSKHGAIQEAEHVFIESGLSLFSKRAISIMEIGFGTGLNCLLTHLHANKLNLNIDYVGIEAYPIPKVEWEQMNYVKQLKIEKVQSVFERIHSLPWNSKNELTTTFSLTKLQQFFTDIEDVDQFDLIYFDAFGARVQPELWTEAIFKKMFIALKNGGVLVTYSAKGSVRRAMQTVGFSVERLPGPPGKREMLRATKK